MVSLFLSAPYKHCLNIYTANPVILSSGQARLVIFVGDLNSFYRTMKFSNFILSFV